MNPHDVEVTAANAGGEIFQQDIVIP